MVEVVCPFDNCSYSIDSSESVYLGNHIFHEHYNKDNPSELIIKTVQLAISEAEHLSYYPEY